MRDRGCAYVFLLRGETDDLNESSLTAFIHSRTEEDHRDGTETLSGNRVTTDIYIVHTHIHRHKHVHYALQCVNLMFKTLAILWL